MDGMCEGMRADSTGNKWHSDEPLSAPQAGGDQREAVTPAVDEEIGEKRTSHQIVSYLPQVLLLRRRVGEFVQG